MNLEQQIDMLKRHTTICSGSLHQIDRLINYYSILWRVQGHLNALSYSYLLILFIINSWFIVIRIIMNL